MSFLSVALYLLPVVALVLSRSRADRRLWEIALDIPTFVGADLVGVLVLARLLPLEQAALLSRPLWLAGALAIFLRRRARKDAWAWPAELGLRQGAAVLVASGLAWWLSTLISRKHHIWDRYWHINLVSSIRGQRVPFSNVYDPSGALSYHYTGDALGAMLQSFSLGSLHASWALSLAHDVVFALSGATLGLLLLARGGSGWPRITLGVAAWLLTGPTALLRDDGKQWTGYNFVNYLSLSFRPHTAIAGLLLVGFVGAALVRAWPGAGEEGPRARQTAVPLLLTFAALSVTDETTCALLGLGLGVAWLIWPKLLGLSFRQGLVLMLALAASVVITNLLCAGLLSPFAERPPVKLAAWRSPGFMTPALPFGTPDAVKLFFGDVAGLLAFAAISVWALARSSSRPLAATSALVLALVALGLFGLGRADVAPSASESHRFVTASMLVAPLVVLSWLFSHDGPGRSPFVQSASILALALPAASTLAWIRSPGETGFSSNPSFHTQERFYRTDCRAELGTRLGEKPRPTYLAQDVLFVYTGCHPVFTAGRKGTHKIKASWPLFGWDAFLDLHGSMLRADEPLDVVCPVGSNDAICLRALERGCAPVGKTRRGTEIVRCTLDGAERARLVAERK